MVTLAVRLAPTSSRCEKVLMSKSFRISNSLFRCLCYGCARPLKAKLPPFLSLSENQLPDRRIRDREQRSRKVEEPRNSLAETSPLAVASEVLRASQKERKVLGPTKRVGHKRLAITLSKLTGIRCVSFTMEIVLGARLYHLSLHTMAGPPGCRPDDSYWHEMN